MILWSRTLRLLLIKIIYPARSRTVLRSILHDIHETIFEKVFNAVMLRSSVKTRADVYVNALKNKILLRENAVSALKVEHIGVASRMILRNLPMTGEWITPIGVRSAFVLYFGAWGTGLAYKYSQITHSNVLNIVLTEYAISFLYGAFCKAILRSAVHVICARYRLLNEMDDLTLADFDDREMQDVDFVELT
jgi:hypothetical protein